MKKKRNGSRIMWMERPQWQESELKRQRQRLCKSRNRWEMLNGTIGNHTAWNNISLDVECYRRQSEWSCKFRGWGRWGRRGWWWRRFRAWQAEQRWRTCLGDGHNIQNSSAPHGELSAEADEVWWTDSTRMVGSGRLLLWGRYEVLDDWIEGPGCCEAPNRHDSSHTIRDNICRAYPGSWYGPWTITNAASDMSTGKLSNQDEFRETTGRRSQSISDARRGPWFVTDGDCEASSTCMLFLLHIASLANYHIEIGFGRGHGDGSCVSGGVDSQIGIFDVVSWVKEIYTYFVMCKLLQDFSDQIVIQDYLSVSVQGSYGRCEWSSLQIRLIDEQWTVYGVAWYGWIHQLNLNLGRNLLTRCKSVMSDDSWKERSKHIRTPDKWQPSGYNHPCSQLHNSLLTPPAHRREIETRLWYITDIEEVEVDKEWWGRRATNIET